MRDNKTENEEKENIGDTTQRSESVVKKAKTDKPKKPRQKKLRVLFVCTGNTCRSAMANYILPYEAKKFKKASRFTVSSAGLDAEVGGEMSEQAKTALTQRNIPFKKHVPKQLDVATIEKSDYVICMTEYHKYAIEAVTGKRDNLFTAGDFDGNGDVADPYGYGDDV